MYDQLFLKLKYSHYTFHRNNKSLFSYQIFSVQKQPPEVFCEKIVLRNFAKFTGKYLCQNLFYNEVAGQACNFIKRETLTQVLSCELCKISKNTFFHRTPLVAASVLTLNILCLQPNSLQNLILYVDIFIHVSIEQCFVRVYFVVIKRLQQNWFWNFARE